jgi:Flp pilus assembly pilin Flp
VLRSVKRLLQEQTGQTLVVYALLLILLALAAIVALPDCGAAAQSSATQLSLALPWVGVACPEAPDTGSQPEAALRHTRSALIGSEALALSDPASTEVAVFTVGVLGFALGLTVAAVEVSQVLRRARQRSSHR